MAIRRFSAVETFGVPIDNNDVFRTNEGLLRLLDSYGIEGQEIPADIIDITPYYWANPNFRYLMTRETEASPVNVDLMPAHADSETYVPLYGTSFEGFVLAGVRRIVVPTEQTSMVVAGPGPRFDGQMCIHEAIISE